MSEQSARKIEKKETTAKNRGRQWLTTDTEKRENRESGGRQNFRTPETLPSCMILAPT